MRLYFVNGEERMNVREREKQKRREKKERKEGERSTENAERKVAGTIGLASQCATSCAFRIKM